MSEHLDRLGRQLDAIELAIARANAEPDAAQRAHILEVVERASTAARAEYEEAAEAERRRPVLRVIKGGAVAAATASSAEWVRNTWRNHPQAVGAGALTATATLTAAIAYVALSSGIGTPSAPSAAPPSTKPPSSSSWPSAPAGPEPPSPTTASPRAPAGWPRGPASDPAQIAYTSVAPTPDAPPDATARPTPTGLSPSPTPTPAPSPTGTPTGTPTVESPSSGLCLVLDQHVLRLRACLTSARAR